jgi:hypothetical protein
MPASEMDDVSIVIEAMSAARTGRDLDLSPSEWSRFEDLLSDLRTVRDNGARGHTIAEFRAGGELVLLTR